MRLLYGVKYTDMCPFRAIRRDTLARLGMEEETYGWNLEMQMRAARAKLRILEIPVAAPLPHGRRVEGVGHVARHVRGGLEDLTTFLRVARRQGVGRAGRRVRDAAARKRDACATFVLVSTCKFSHPAMAASPRRMNLDAEWLEPDGRGGFASGTVGGARTRRYHALLLPATRPPVARMVLVNGLEVWLETAAGRFPLSTQRYPGGDGGQDVLAPRGQDFLTDFRADPWPRWTFRFPDGTRVEQEIFVHQATGLTALGWRLLNPLRAATPRAGSELRPLFSGRDYHALHHENAAFAFAPVARGQRPGNALWQPYAGVPGVRVWSSGVYRHDPRGIATSSTPRNAPAASTTPKTSPCPACSSATSRRDAAAALLLAARRLRRRADARRRRRAAANAAKLLPALRADEERRRAARRRPLRRAGDAYLVRGGRGHDDHRRLSVVHRLGPRHVHFPARAVSGGGTVRGGARHPAATGRARSPQGMLPNRFPDGGEAPEYNTVDAALWFVIGGARLPRARAPPANEARRVRTPRARPGDAARHLRGDPRGLRRRDALRHPRSTRTTACFSRASPASR